MRLNLPGLLVALVILLFALPSAVRFSTDWLWFTELGYADVFLRTLNAQVIAFTATFLAAFAFLFVNLRIARGTITRPQIVLGTGVDGRAIAIEGKRLAALATPVALVIAFVTGLNGGRHWLDWLKYFNAQPFGQVDPLFGRDVGFYVFSLPVLTLLQQQALLLTALALVGSGVYYVLSGSFVIEARPGAFPQFRLIPAARKHLGLLIALAAGLLAWSAWLRMPGLLLTQATVLFGASYADVHARLPFLWAEVGVLIIGAGAAVAYGFGRRSAPLPIFGAAGLYVVVFLGGGLYASLIQRFVVTPSEQTIEQPYLTYNIEATRRAYNLELVEERELSGDAELTAADIIDNVGTIENVRLWDHQPLLQTFAQLQEIRTYYDFVSVDNDRYTIDGTYRQVMLSARELNSDSLQNRSWVNERLQYTHGYGVTLGPVNQVTTEGLPVLLIRDLPPVSTANLKVDEPSIYYGELANSYVLVGTEEPEFHYPRGEDNETTYYQGDGGVPVSGLLRRLMFAMRFASTEILFSGQITNDSRIMFNRRISERVETLAPFLAYDSDPYLVVVDGRLYWIQDAYTTTGQYPYSTPWPAPVQQNYIRNAVKIVIDAYHGTTTFYVADEEDPLIRTLSVIFPTLLKPIADMPAGIREHVRYPEDMFSIQAQIFTTFHMTNPLVFYNKEDQWQVPVLDGERGAVAMQPYYTIMRLPGADSTEFIQMLPFTPRLKDNLAAWMVARSDGEHYGRLLVFQFPKQKIVFGPRQIVGRINQDQIISPQITLWNQQGSQVIWGTLLVIPVEESLLYVRPLYLRSPEGRIPELKRVIVAYQNRIVMAETLPLGLVQIFGPSVAPALAADARAVAGAEPAPPGAGPTPSTPGLPSPAARSIADLAAEASRHFDLARQALRDGDWARYGDEMRRVEEILAEIRRIAR
jgi:uncharacterized membrane protein (UPF0182 family)